MFKLTPDKENREAIRFTKELQGRMEFVLKELPVRTAEDVLVMVRDGIPSDPEYDAYRDSLGVYEVVESDPELYVVGVFGKPKPLSLKMIDTFRTVLYIQPSSRTGQESEAALILRRYEPWTVTTLPFEPPPDEADVVARRVSVREVNLLEVRLKKVLPVVERQLRAVGVTPREAPRILLNRKVLLDLSFFALRLEFGYDGYPYRPHWRPALRKVMSRKHPEPVREAMLDPKFKGWKRMPKVSEKVPARAVQVDDFEDRTQV